MTNATLSMPATTQPGETEASEPIPRHPAAGASDDVTSRRVLLAYAAPALTGSLLFTAISMYLLKYATDVLLIGPATVGLVFGLSRFWDAVTDPVVGFMSDRTRSPMGRRRPWLLASALPVGIAYVAVWSPPTTLEGHGMVAWLTLSLLLFYTAITAYNVPYTALGAELSIGYHERTRVFSARAFGDHAGIVFSAAAIIALENAPSPRGVAGLLAAGAALVAVTCMLWPAISLRERVEYQGRGGRGNPYRSFGDVFRNPHARLLLGVFFLETLGFHGLVTLLPYMTEYVLLQPGMTGFYLFGAIGATLVSIPVWLPLSRRFGKAPVWTASLALKVGLFLWLGFLGPGDHLSIATITALFGVASGAGAVLGPSLQADVIDSDEASTGERKEGVFFSAWAFAMKAAVGVAILLSGTVLEWTGFQPNTAQGEETLFGMRLLFSYLPVLLHAIAVLMLLRFRLGADAHAALRGRIHGTAPAA